MRHGFLGSLVALCLLTAAAHAQLPTFFYPNEIPADEFAPSDRRVMKEPECGYLRSEYLIWWQNRGPSSFPLLTTGPISNPNAAKLGEPDTQIIIGGNGFNYKGFNGTRFTLGYWLENDIDPLALEASGFVLEQRSVGATGGTDPNGNFAVSRPFFFPDGSNHVFDVAFPTVVDGTAHVTSTTQFLGAELNLVGRIDRQDNFNAEILYGFKYLNLHESLRITQTSVDAGGGFLPGVSSLDLVDAFSTNNNFYGGQIGTRMEITSCRWYWMISGKLALGVNDSSVSVSGNTTQYAPGGAVTVSQGGLLTQPSNIGRRDKIDWAVVPEIGTNVGFQISPKIRAMVGYTFIYWNNVARPGNQIDPTINPGQIPFHPLFGIPGPSRPAQLFDRSELYTHGFNIGLNFIF